ncbi:MAG: hypothetical protein M1821_002362 [Bathelium mastoideum]|nr:MAG: hypothetical protein M1821_002362 [Bathelium mastoideum]
MEIPYQMDFADHYYDKSDRNFPRSLPKLRASCHSQDSPCPVTPPQATEPDEQSFHHALQSIKAEIQEMNNYYSTILRDADQARASTTATTAPSVQPQAIPQPGSPSSWQLLQGLRTDIRGLDARLELLESRYERLEDRLSRLEPGTPPETPAPCMTQLVDLDPPEIASSTTAWPLQDEKANDNPPSDLPLAVPDDIGYFNPKDSGPMSTCIGVQQIYHDVMFFTASVRAVAEKKRVLCIRSCLRGRAQLWWAFLLPDTRAAIESGNVELACDELMRHFALPEHSAFVALVNHKFTLPDLASGRRLCEDYGQEIHRLCLHARLSGDQLCHTAKLFIYNNLDPDIFYMFPEPADDPDESIIDYLHKLRERGIRAREAVCRPKIPEPPIERKPERRLPPSLSHFLSQPAPSSSSNSAASSSALQAPAPPPPPPPPPPPLPPKHRSPLTPPPPSVRFSTDVSTIEPPTTSGGPPPQPRRGPPVLPPPPTLRGLHRSQSLHHLPGPSANPSSAAALSGPALPGAGQSASAAAELRGRQGGRHNPYSESYVMRHRPNPYRIGGGLSGEVHGGGASAGGERDGGRGGEAREGSGGKADGRAPWQAYVEDEDRAYQRALRNSRVEY